MWISCEEEEEEAGGGGGGGGGGPEEAGVQNQKQEPHTKMWGKKSFAMAIVIPAVFDFVKAIFPFPHKFV